MNILVRLTPKQEEELKTYRYYYKYFATDNPPEPEVKGLHVSKFNLTKETKKNLETLLFEIANEARKERDRKQHESP